MIFLGAGCGPDHNNNSSTPAAPLINPYPDPFNASAGEGNLTNSQLVMTYPTKGNPVEAAVPQDAPAQPGLDIFYEDLICSGLTQQQCDANVANLNTPEFGNFNLAEDPIGNNPLKIKLIDAVKIDYTAINVDKSALTVSGGILIPRVSPSAIKGIILYFHGTTVERNAVPSSFTPTTNINSYTDGVVLAAIWASQGYVIVMPDYIGLGDDTTHPHPYVLYPSQNAQSGLAMVKAARSLLSNSYGINGLLPLYITGYSEGGAYSLQAGHMMQNNPRYASVLDVDLKTVVPLSGFFDLSGTGLPYLFDNITNSHNNWHSLSPAQSALSKPYLSAYLVLSFAHYSGINAASILASKFYNCPSGFPCGASNNLYGLYFTAKQSAGYSAQVALLAYALATQTGWSVDHNAITPLLTPEYAQALMHLDPNNPLYQSLVQADTYRFIPTFPVTLDSLIHDSVVPRNNSDVAFAYFTGQKPGGPYQEELVPNSDFLVYSSLTGAAKIDHTTEVPFMSVLILNEFNAAP